MIAAALLAAAVAASAPEEPCFNDFRSVSPSTVSRPTRPSSSGIKPSMAARPASSPAIKPRKLKRLPSEEYPCGEMSPLPPMTFASAPPAEVEVSYTPVPTEPAPPASLPPTWAEPATPGCECFSEVVYGGGWPGGYVGGGGGFYVPPQGHNPPPVPPVSPVPEPGTWAMLAAGFFFLSSYLFRRRRA